MRWSTLPIDADAINSSSTERLCANALEFCDAAVAGMGNAG
jgi:hypothetical protein